MNKIQTLVISLIISLSSITFGFASEVIGVIAAGIGDITNQKNEKLATGSKIYFGDTIIVKAQSNAHKLC